MPRLEWVPGPEPKRLTEDGATQIIELFLAETGEIYSDVSIRPLPIPAWDANLILIDLDQPSPQPIQGVLWATPFKDTIVRVAAFVICETHQSKGLGNIAWERFRQIASESGYHEVQLEVKANNTGAQRFYKLRGLTVRQELVGYYQSGLGYMMRGPLNP